MIIGKVIGNLWSTKKDDKLNGKRFLIIKKINKNNKVDGEICVAVDKIGAGIGENVLVTTGTNAKYTFENEIIPIDMAIIGIIDSIDITE